jgi:hypothetical protein
MLFLIHRHQIGEDASQNGKTVLEAEDAYGDEVGVEPQVNPQLGRIGDLFVLLEAEDLLPSGQLTSRGYKTVFPRRLSSYLLTSFSH